MKRVACLLLLLAACEDEIHISADPNLVHVTVETRRDYATVNITRLESAVGIVYVPTPFYAGNSTTCSAYGVYNTLAEKP